MARIRNTACRDEALDKIQNVDDVAVRLRAAFTDGIDILGRRAYFLCSSGSQIREHKVRFRFN